MTADGAVGAGRGGRGWPEMAFAELIGTVEFRVGQRAHITVAGAASTAATPLAFTVQTTDAAVPLQSPVPLIWNSLSVAAAAEVSVTPLTKLVISAAVQTLATLSATALALPTDLAP